MKIINVPSATRSSDVSVGSWRRAEVRPCECPAENRMPNETPSAAISRITPMKNPNGPRRLTSSLALLLLLCFQMPGVHAGLVVVHSGNLLLNPSASSSSISPWMPIGNGTWAIQTGADGFLNSCDGSRWFLNHRIITKAPCNGCSSSGASSMAQTVNLSNYATVIQNNSPRLVYGGDAFAAVTITPACTTQFCHAGAFEANFTVEFLNSANVVLVTDSSGPIFHSGVSCGLPYPALKKCAFRRTVNVIPPGTTSLRFIAKMTDSASLCDFYTTTFKFSNGFDNLGAEIIYSSNDSSSGNPNRVKKPTPTPPR